MYNKKNERTMKKVKNKEFSKSFELSLGKICVMRELPEVYEVTFIFPDGEISFYRGFRDEDHCEKYCKFRAANNGCSAYKYSFIFKVEF